MKNVKPLIKPVLKTFTTLNYQFGFKWVI